MKYQMKGLIYTKRFGCKYHQSIQRSYSWLNLNLNNCIATHLNLQTMSYYVYGSWNDWNKICFFPVEQKNTTLPCLIYASMINFVKRTSLKLTMLEFCTSNFYCIFLIFVISSVFTVYIITQRQNDWYNVPVIFMDINKPTINHQKSHQRA